MQTRYIIKALILVTQRGSAEGGGGTSGRVTNLDALSEFTAHWPIPLKLICPVDKLGKFTEQHNTSYSLSSMDVTGPRT